MPSVLHGSFRGGNSNLTTTGCGGYWRLPSFCARAVRFSPWLLRAPAADRRSARQLPAGSRSTESHAEILLYESLKPHLPEGWYAWHSLRVREGDGIFGEGDFVVVDPDRGLLAVEVKGGNIEQRDGRWFQNGTEMRINPRAQGNEFVRKLISRLERDACAPPAYGVATCFPDVSFDAPPDQDDLSRTTIGKQDLPWLDERLKSLMEDALPRARRPRGPWIDHLHKIWGETWIPKLGLGHRAHLEDSERAKLDADQIRILDMVEANSNLLVEGGAGTGKTLIAREAACRFAEKGGSVLLLATGAWWVPDNFRVFREERGNRGLAGG